MDRGVTIIISYDFSLHWQLSFLRKCPLPSPTTFNFCLVWHRATGRPCQSLQRTVKVSSLLRCQRLLDETLLRKKIWPCAPSRCLDLTSIWRRRCPSLKTRVSSASPLLLVLTFFLPSSWTVPQDVWERRAIRGEGRCYDGLARGERSRRECAPEAADSDGGDWREWGRWEELWIQKLHLLFAIWCAADLSHLLLKSHFKMNETECDNPLKYI